MPLSINKNKYPDTNRYSMDDVNKMIKDEVERYLENVMKYSNLEMVFLKSFIYVEDLLGIINEKLFNLERNGKTGVFIWLKNYRSIQGIDNRFLSDLSFLIERRNNIAHSLDYNFSKDIDLISKLGVNHDLSVEENKHKIALYFKDIIHGILFVKVGLEVIPGFIEYIDNK